MLQKHWLVQENVVSLIHEISNLIETDPVGKTAALIRMLNLANYLSKLKNLVYRWHQNARHPSAPSYILRVTCDTNTVLGSVAMFCFGYQISVKLMLINTCDFPN